MILISILVTTLCLWLIVLCAVLFKQSRQIRHLKKAVEKDMKEEDRLNKIQSQLLTRYAFINSHKIRGPLARILGLVHLLEIDQDSNKEQLYKWIHDSARELDTSIRATNRNIKKVTKKVTR